MRKTTIFFILSLCLLELCYARRRKRESANGTAMKWRNYSNKCSSIPIDVRLHDLSISYTEFENTNVITTGSYPTGLLEVLHPLTPSPLFLCYPSNEDDYRQIYLFSHITCRQLNFMTVTNVNQKELPSTFDSKPYYGLGPNSYRCTGQEQTVSHCNWQNMSIESCPMLAEISCGVTKSDSSVFSACHRTIKDISGIVKNPGFPLVYFFDVTCQWDLIVPDKHTILLTFNQFDAMDSGFSSHVCHLHKPYVEIIYGYQNQFSFYRYCNLHDLKNLSIPFHEAKIRIFSGFYPNEKFRSLKKEQGLVFSFEAIPLEEGRSSPWKIIFFTLFFCIAIIAVILCHYCQKHGICDYKEKMSILPGPNAPAMEDLNRAYEFQRCNIQGNIQGTNKTKQGLRMRSVGSGTNLSNQYLSHSVGTNYEVAKDFRKQLTQTETPRTVIPDIVLNYDGGEEEKQNAIHRAKANLLDRYSDKDSDGSTNKLSVGSSVFYPVPSFSIYTSVSSEKSDEGKKEPIPRETFL